MHYPIIIGSFVVLLMCCCTRWGFSLFLSWWWPLKEESPATLLYAAVECMDDDLIVKHWVKERGGISCKLLAARIVDPYDDYFSLSIKNKPFRNLTQWDTYLIVKLYNRVVKVLDEADSRNCLRDTAETMLKGMNSIRAHLDKLEERQIFTRASNPNVYWSTTDGTDTSKDEPYYD